jgi:hypothetical protein
MAKDVYIGGKPVQHRTFTLLHFLLDSLASDKEGKTDILLVSQQASYGEKER